MQLTTRLLFLVTGTMILKKHYKLQNLGFALNTRSSTNNQPRDLKPSNEGIHDGMSISATLVKILN